MYKLKMFKKLAKIKYLPNNFEIVEDGDHVICAISGKKYPFKSLNYWNVELQEPYFFRMLKRQLKGKVRIKLFLPPIMCPNPLIRVFNN